MSNWRIGKYPLPKSCGVADTTHHSTGINTDFKNGISIYPNPSKEKLFVSGYALRGNAIEVRNLYGQVCNTSTSQNGFEGFEINISNLSNGIYFIKLIDARGFRQVLKFVKE